MELLRKTYKTLLIFLGVSLRTSAMHPHNVFTDNRLLYRVLSFPLNSLGTPFTSRTFHMVLSLPGIHFSLTYPLVWITSTYLSELTPFQIHLLWLGTLTMASHGWVHFHWALLLTSSHCCVINCVLICLLIISKVLWSRLFNLSLYSQCLAQYLTQSSHSIMNK